MTRPTPHPTTGTLRVRVAIPKHLREIAARHHGRHRTEFIESLKTKDGALAKRLAPAVVAKFQDWLAAAQAEHDGRATRLSDYTISALCGEWIKARDAAHAKDLPTSFHAFETEIDFLGDIIQGLEGIEGACDSPVSAALETMGEDITALLANAGLHADQESRERLAVRLVPLYRHVLQDLQERAQTGRWRQTVKPHEFPVLEKPEAASTIPTVTDAAGTTFDVLLERWALDRGYKPDAKPIARNLYDRKRTIERLATFLGHRDAQRVTQADAVRWKVSMQTAGSHASTIRNDLSECSAIWKFGIANGLVGQHGNPFAGVSPPKAKTKQQTRRAFTDTEAAAIIEASRGEKGALRWLPIALCLTGARLTEIVQSVREDVLTIDGVAVLRIHDDDGKVRSLKNAESRRTVPLHPALIDEGFLAYVVKLKPGSPLFPDIKPDGMFGTRGANASRLLSRWLRGLGYTDPAISPAHSWRHWLVGACRRVNVPMEVRSAITGHSAKMDESAGYGEGVGTMVQVMADWLGKVRVPGRAA